MPILVEVLTGSRRGHRVVLHKAVIRLGRHPDNDVVFDPVAEPLVSGHHAEIREAGPSQWVLVDCGSSNGTWVGGHRVASAPIPGRTEVTLAQNGPAIALMPMASVPAQAADAPGIPRTPAAGRIAYDPMVVAPTADSGGRDVAPAPGAAPGGRFIAPPVGPADIGTAPTMMRGSGPVSGSPVAPAPVQPGRMRTTAYIRAVASDMMKRSSRRFIVTIAILTVLLLGAIAFAILVGTGWIDLSPSDERPAISVGLPVVAPTGPPLAGGTADGGAGAADAEGPEKVAPQDIVEANRYAIFLLGVYDRGQGEGFCTGFAMTERILATNAHCVVEMEKVWRLLGAGQGVYAFQNERPGVRIRVEYAMKHPDYLEEDDRNRISPDIGLVVLESPTEHRVRLSSKESAKRVRVGDRLYLLGFPGTLNNTESPVATLTEGVVSRLTDLAQRRAEPADSVLMQHSAFTTKGTSGSPLFDEYGTVVGINTGYYRGESEQQRVDPVTGRIRAETVSQDLLTYAIGMRVDLLHDLLKLLYERIGGGADGGGTAQP